MAYDAANDNDQERLREEAEHDSEVAKERAELRKKHDKELHDEKLRRDLKDLTFKRDQKKRERDGLAYEAPHLERAISEGRRSGNSGEVTRKLDQQRDKVRTLKEKLEKLKAEQRSHETRVEQHTRLVKKSEEQVREAARALQAETAAGRDAAQTLERLQSEHAHVLTELGALMRERTTVAERGHEEATEQSAEQAKETRAVTELESQLRTLEANDRTTTDQEAASRRTLESDRRDAERASVKTGPDDGTTRELESEERKDKSDLAALSRDIKTDEQELRLLTERIDEKKRRLGLLTTTFEEIEQKLGLAKRKVSRPDASIDAKVANDEAEVERLAKLHTDYTGRMKELQSEIQEHTVRATALARSTTHSTTTRSSEELERKISTKEHERDQLTDRIRDAERAAKSVHHANDNDGERTLEDEKREVDESTRAKTRVEQDTRTAEQELRDAERLLATYTNDNEKAEDKDRERTELARTAASRKRAQDAKLHTIDNEMSDLDTKIRDIERQLAA